MRKIIKKGIIFFYLCSKPLWQRTQFYIILKQNCLQTLINKGKIVFYYLTKKLRIYYSKWVSRYLLNTHRKVSKKVSKVYSEVFGAWKKPVITGLLLLSTTLFVLFPATTWTLYSHIICIICIYNITCISGFSRLGNIYIICIICTIYIINISLLWTNCGHRPHPFTAIIIPYFKVQ